MTRNRKYWRPCACVALDCIFFLYLRDADDDTDVKDDGDIDDKVDSDDTEDYDA